MSLRNTLRKAAGLLVELPPEADVPDADVETSARNHATSSTDDMWAELEKAAQKPSQTGPSPGARTVEQIVREGQGPNLDQIKLAADALPTSADPGGKVDFNVIYQAASLPTVPFTSEQVLDMLASLPDSIPIESRRQMIKVSINAMGKAIGATPENIVADASRKLAALAAYTDHLAQTTTEYVSLSEQKIAHLQAEIEKTRLAALAAQQRQTRETQLCTEESHRLDDILEFFSLDVPPSRYAPDGPTVAG
jgi:hypothetical protein